MIRTRLISQRYTHTNMAVPLLCPEVGAVVSVRCFLWRKSH